MRRHRGEPAPHPCSWISGQLCSLVTRNPGPFWVPDRSRAHQTRLHTASRVADCLPQLIAHDALSALINLTNSAVATHRIAQVDGFVAGLVRMIIVSWQRVASRRGKRADRKLFYRARRRCWQTSPPCCFPT